MLRLNEKLLLSNIFIRGQIQFYTVKLILKMNLKFTYSYHCRQYFMYLATLLLTFLVISFYRCDNQISIVSNQYKSSHCRVDIIIFWTYNYCWYVNLTMSHICYKLTLTITQNKFSFFTSE